MKIIILSVVWYGSETWSLILREVYRVRVLEGRGRKTILGPKGNEVRANCNKFDSWSFRGDWIRLNILRADCYMKKWNVENIHGLTQLSGGHHCVVTNFFMICIHHQIFGYSNQEWWCRQAMWHAWEWAEMHSGFGRGNLIERYQLEGLSVWGQYQNGTFSN